MAEKYSQGFSFYASTSNSIFFLNHPLSPALGRFLSEHVGAPGGRPCLHGAVSVRLGAPALEESLSRSARQVQTQTSGSRKEIKQDELRSLDAFTRLHI